MVKVSMDILIEALFQAVLSEENKPLSVRHRRVKDRILEAEGAMRQMDQAEAPRSEQRTYSLGIPRTTSPALAARKHTSDREHRELLD